MSIREERDRIEHTERSLEGSVEGRAGGGFGAGKSLLSFANGLRSTGNSIFCQGSSSSESRGRETAFAFPFPLFLNLASFWNMFSLSASESLL